MKLISRLKIDYLIVFFLLSLVTLYSFVGDVSYFFPQKEEQSFRNTTFKNFIESKYVFKHPEQGLINSTDKLINYNPDYKLLYSLDGGLTYELYDNQPILELEPNQLINKVTSIRSKSSFGELPQVIALIVKAEHIDGKHFTKPKLLTFYGKYQSNLPFVSLVVNENDLFDEQKGIMTLGEESWNDKGFYNKFWDRKTNFKKRGVESKKAVFVQLFKSNHLEYQTTSICQVSGNATRSFPQKSIKLKSIRDNKFKYGFFKGDGLKKYKSIVLRQSGNDNKKTLFADLLMQNLATELPVLTQKGLMINVFINGNYWGVYNLRERYDAYFIGKSAGVKEKKVTILEGGNGELKKGSKKNRTKFISLIDTISNKEEATTEMVDYLKARIDIASFTYYILLETYYGNGDWLNNNVMWYKVGDGKWKWLLNDLDYSLTYSGVQNVNVNYFDIIGKSNSVTANMFNFLIKNEEYKSYFKTTNKLFLETYLTEEKIREEYAELKNTLEPNIDDHINRWRGNFTKEEWLENCNDNLNFLLERNQIFIKQVAEL